MRPVHLRAKEKPYNAPMSESKILHDVSTQEERGRPEHAREVALEIKYAGNLPKCPCS